MKHGQDKNGKRRWMMFAAPVAAALATAACTTLNVGGGSAVDADAAAVLKAASEKIASAEQFTFRGRRTLDPGLVEGRKVKQDASIEVAVKRPNKIASSSTDRTSGRQLYYDGTDVTLYDAKANHYATVDGASTIDKTIDQLAAKWNFTPPLADLLVSDLGSRLRRRALSGKLAGTETVAGVKCHHVAVTQKNVDWDIWIGVSDSLPRRFVITFKEEEGSPQLKADISRWDLNANLANSKFVFTPPKGAQKIEMVPIR